MHVSSYTTIVQPSRDSMFLFVWFDSLHPINNLSVIKGRVFMGLTSTKLGLMFLLEDTTQWRQWGSNQQLLCLESSTLPLRSPFLEIDHEIISTVILLPYPDSFKKGYCQLQAKVCAQSTGYPLVQACPSLSRKRVWLGELTVPTWQ